MFDKIDKLNKDEVENYLSSCLYFEWISDYYLTENLPYHISDRSAFSRLFTLSCFIAL